MKPNPNYHGAATFIDRGAYVDYYPTGAPPGIKPMPWSLDIAVKPPEPQPEVRFVDILPDGWL